ncbi:MAG: DUF262 domain-containing protein [Flavobacterium sp.]|nr:MAG: DUF262 domain-containing protein [Flavobacterium sp.]
MAEIENPRIRPFGELLQENFFVPRYQRGYRWGKQEITELLDDIFQYYLDSKPSNTEKKPGKFYCLQPIVIKAKQWKGSSGEDIVGWELIDGQQRITSLFIILTFLEDVRQFYDNKTVIYNIDFETRENCKFFFGDKIFVNKIDDSNVDFFHISNAYKCVRDWFADKPTLRIEMLKTILGTENNVCVIWYESPGSKEEGDESSIELFTRLNEGKIPLTDAELIKALLLQADMYPIKEERFVRQRLFEIANEWDDIESKLQDEKMWLFLNDVSYMPSSKIEFIFKLLADKWNGGNTDNLIKYEVKDDRPKHFEFIVFDKYLSLKRAEFQKGENSGKDILGPINAIWKEVKEMFSIFYEWYCDHTLYHYLGFLLAQERDKDVLIRELIDLKLDKEQFENDIKMRIGQAIKITKKDKLGILRQLNQISYKDDNEEIIKILLLFNVDALIKHNKENARFPFHLYKKEKITSIEHIHPQNPPNFDTDEGRATTWLLNHKKSLESSKNRAGFNIERINLTIREIDDLLGQYDKEKFKLISVEIVDLYNEVASGNSTSNLQTHS